jgi:hypothetical protein
MCIVLSSYMGDRIRRMSMNVAFWLWQKEIELLNLWKDYPSLYNVSNFSWLWLSSSKDKICNILAHLVKSMRSRKWCYEQLKEQGMLN